MVSEILIFYQFLIDFCRRSFHISITQKLSLSIRFGIKTILKSILKTFHKKVQWLQRLFHISAKLIKKQAYWSMKKSIYMSCFRLKFFLRNQAWPHHQFLCKFVLSEISFFYYVSTVLIQITQLFIQIFQPIRNYYASR